jgi:Arc/MetJ-type ribon-helix-helix transcriptional regulator
MRTTLNISMPVSFKKNVDQAVKEGNYASISEFFRDAVRAWQDERLIRELKESQRDARMGKFKKLSSFRDLR